MCPRPKDKIRTMLRSAMLSTSRTAKDKALAHRSVRRRVHVDLSRCQLDSEYELDERRDPHVEIRALRWDKSWNSAAFCHWAERVTHGLPIEDRLSKLQGRLRGRRPVRHILRRIRHRDHFNVDLTWCGWKTWFGTSSRSDSWEKPFSRRVCHGVECILANPANLWPFNVAVHRAYKRLLRQRMGLITTTWDEGAFLRRVEDLPRWWNHLSQTHETAVRELVVAWAEAGFKDFWFEGVFVAKGALPE